MSSSRTLLSPYRQVLAVPGFKPLALVAFLSRIPVTATGVTLTLYVVQDLHRGYAAAGAVGTAATIASALSGPVIGRIIDRRGLRLALMIGTCGELLFWSVSPFLPYAALLVFAGIAGLFRLPVFTVVRQSITALVPAEQRKAALSLDAMMVELSFMIGPAAATVMVTSWSGRSTMYTIAAAMTIAGIALFWLNPPIRSPRAAADPQDDSDPQMPGPRSAQFSRPGIRSWLSPAMLVQFALATASTLALSGSDISVVAQLRQSGQLGYVGLVIGIWCFASMIGGFIYGLLTRSLSSLVLVGLLCLLTVPVGIAGTWQLMCLLLIPAGLFCAPSLTSSVDATSALAPQESRGEILGWHGAALTAGNAIGAPLAGAVIDRSGPPFGFVAVGLLGIAVALVAFMINRWSELPRATNTPWLKGHVDEPVAQPVAANT